MQKVLIVEYGRPSIIRKIMRALVSNEQSPVQSILLNLCGRFIPLSLALGGGFLAFFGYQQMQKEMQSEDWPSVIGFVESSKINLVTTTDADGHRDTNYDLVVVYNYTVDGDDLQNDVLQFGWSNYSKRSSAEKVLKKYTAGLEVDVYYDPQDPNTSVLIPGVGNGSYTKIVFRVLFSIFWLVFLFLCGLIRKAVDNAEHEPDEDNETFDAEEALIILSEILLEGELEELDTELLSTQQLATFEALVQTLGNFNSEEEVYAYYETLSDEDRNTILAIFTALEGDEDAEGDDGNEDGDDPDSEDDPNEERNTKGLEGV